MSVSAEDLAREVPGLYRTALSLTRDPVGAEDLVQETMVRALERSGQYHGDAPLLAWLRRILHNLAVDRARRSAREIVMEEVEDRWRDDAYTVDPAFVVETTLQREEIEDALVHLPFIYRSAIVLHDIVGWTVAEIADAQDIDLPAAKQRLRRGRMALVSLLGSDHIRRATMGVPMRCWDARQHVSDYLDGTLDAEVAATVERHLEVCPTCPPLYAALVGVHDALGRLRDPDTVIPPGLVARLGT